jgi:hypothetical protein
MLCITSAISADQAAGERYDRGAYDASHLDWASLRALSGRAARRTARPPDQAGPSGSPEGEVRYWVLERREQRMWESSPSPQAERRYQGRYSYCLRTDGALFVRVEQWEEAGAPDGWAISEHTLRDRPMEDRDVLLLDVAREHRRYRHGSKTGEGDHMPGTRLIAPVKGAGLARLLEELMTAPGPASPQRPAAAAPPVGRPRRRPVMPSRRDPLAMTIALTAGFAAAFLAIFVGAVVRVWRDPLAGAGSWSTEGELLAWAGTAVQARMLPILVLLTVLGVAPRDRRWRHPLALCLLAPLALGWWAASTGWPPLPPEGLLPRTLAAVHTLWGSATLWVAVGVYLPVAAWLGMIAAPEAAWPTRRRRSRLVERLSILAVVGLLIGVAVGRTVASPSGAEHTRPPLELTRPPAELTPPRAELAIPELEVLPDVGARLLEAIGEPGGQVGPLEAYGSFDALYRIAEVESLNVRAMPDIEAAVVSVLGPADVVAASGRTSPDGERVWQEIITADGTVGWASGRYLVQATR